MNPQTPSDRSDKNLFFEALDLPTPEARAVFLSRVCADDPAQRQRLEALIENHFRKNQFMAQPAAPPEETLSASMADEAIGSQIGRYKLLEKIGEGGFGSVYVAEQKTPVKRRVALKIIKLGMDTRQVVARFEAEGQALAMMDHPNIARVFDAGTTEKGRPFFVMELVHGEPITKFCDENQLNTSERLNLFAQVCHGVEHAHQKGIIHRDIKPTNILVTLHDGVPVPKIIDFGIAKATQGDLTEKTIYTEFHQLIGTPAYMSPEQAEMSGLGIDTRTDIYALGVLLYELLVGKTPFDGKELIRSGLDEMRRTIREKEPQWPSTRLTRDLSVGQRQTESQREELARRLRGDLDWIVMKCLEKDRTRRYATANELTADLQRHLKNEPVSARPPTLAYQFQKAWRRHRLMISSAALIALILVAATSVSVWLAVDANAARKDALKAKNTESLERQRADAQRGEAQRNLYAANLSLAPQAWAQNDFIRLGQILDDTRSFPDRGFEWRYWRRQFHESFRVFRGHALDLRAAVFSPDGKRMATAGEDSTAKIWDIQTGAELLTFDKHPDFLSSLHWSADGKWILSSSVHQIRAWNPDDGREIFTIINRGARIGAVALSQDDALIAAGFGDGSARIYRTRDQLPVVEIAGNGKGVRTVAFSPNGRMLATAGSDHVPRIYDTSSGAELMQFHGHKLNEWVRSVAFSPDNRRLLTASDDSTAKVWDIQTGSELLNLDGHGHYVSAAAYSPDGQRIVTGSFDWTAKLWDAENGRELTTFKGHLRDVNSVFYARDGSRIATTGYDQSAIVWSLNARERKIPIAERENILTTLVALSADGRFVAASSEDYSVRILEMKTGRLWKRLRGARSSITSIAFSEDGSRLSAGCQKSEGLIWNLADESVVALATRNDDELLCAAFSPDGARLASGGRDQILRVWDTATGTVSYQIDVQAGAVFSLAYSPDRRTLAIGTLDNFTILFDASNGKELRRLRGHDSGILAMAFSANGERLATASWDRTARVWDTETGRELLTLSGHSGWLRAIAFSPDGKRIVTGSEDKTTGLWSMEDGRQLLALPGEARAIRFSRDGSRIATAGALDAGVWTAATEEEIINWDRQEREARAAAVLAQTNFINAWQAKIEEQKRDPGAITKWRFLGPLPLNANETGADAVRRIQVQEEREFVSNLATNALIDGQSIPWRPKELKHFAIDFFEQLGSAKTIGIGYARCVIHSDRERNDLRLHVGSDDQSRIYLNGKVIYESVQSRSYQADEDEVEGFSLRAGENVLLFKVINESSQWWGSVRVTDSQGRPPQGIRISN